MDQARKNILLPFTRAVDVIARKLVDPCLLILNAGHFDIVISLKALLSHWS